MRKAEALIPARFLTLISHLCMIVTLLWESLESTSRCLPQQYHESHLQTYQKQLVAGYGASLGMLAVELLTFMCGITMFSTIVGLTSAFCHGLATLILAYFMLDSWHCGWFWFIFAFCSVIPFIIDLGAEEHHLTKTNYKSYQGQWTLLLALAGVVTTIGSSVPVGYNIGVVNTPANTIRSFCNESFISRYNVTMGESTMNILWSSIVSIFIIGGCIGSIIGGLVADKIGRKGAIHLANLLALIGAALFYFCRTANSVEMLLIGRFLVGLAGGLTMGVVPMYLTELAPLRLIGAMGIFCPLGVTFGVLLGQIMGLDAILGGADNWPSLLSAYGILVIICAPILFFIPESPKYLYVIKSNYELAIRELTRIRGVSASILTDEVEQLRTELAAIQNSSPPGSEDSHNFGMLRVATEKKLRLPFLLMCSMQAGQQLSGINAVFYYSASTFKAAGLDSRGAALATLGAGITNFSAQLIAVGLATRARRTTMLWSVAGAALSLALLGISGAVLESIDWIVYAAIGAMMLYVLTYGLGLGPIPYFIGSEFFEVGSRPAAMAWGSLANWAGNFLVGMSFPSIQALIGPYAFLIFSGITLALFFFLRAYFPETRGRTPAEIAALCKDGLRSRPVENNTHVIQPLHKD